MLIVPAHRESFTRRASERGSDAVMLDLEDSVPASGKEEARFALPDAVVAAGSQGADVLVRINKEWPLAFLDLDVAVRPGVRGIFLPKAEDPADIHAIDRLIEDRERREGLQVGSIEISFSIETARGMMNDLELARSSPRIRTISSAIEDFVTELDLQLSEDAEELGWIKARIVLVARAAGIQPMGVVGHIGDFRDLVRFENAARRARAMGYQGAGCIHPDQVPILNRIFGVSDEEVDKAVRIIAAAREAERQGLGAFDVDGVMVDLANVKWARRVLARADGHEDE
jgi:citrate lyase subunit beta/citryl-CoA lyase